MMRPLLTAFVLLLAGSSPVQADTPREDVAAVAPALDVFTRQELDGNVWARPALSSRDRSIVTLAVLIARNQPADLQGQLRAALDSGVTAVEVSELITHLAFYAGWGNAYAAVPAVRAAFVERGVRADQLLGAAAPSVRVDEAEDVARAAGVRANAGPVSPGLAADTNEVLFGQLWRRSGLAPCDRSLATVASLIALGQTSQMTYHLNRAMDAGLTKAQAGEVISHIAWYAGWPNVFSALPVAKQVFENRKD